MTMTMPPVIIHVPHASVIVPEDVRPTFCIDDATLAAELLRMTDRFTDELFQCPADQALTQRYAVSRLVVDPERFESDDLEPMASKGMGAVYTRLSDGRPLRQSLSAEARQQLLDRFYRPHHARLEQAVHASINVHQRALIIDAHSFASRPLPHEPDRSPDRPEICIGTDPFHTPDRLRDSAVEAFEHLGFTVEVNRPFGGSIVPTAFYGRDPRVSSVMIEVRRDLYMDEQSGERNANFSRLRDAVTDVLRVVASAAG